MIQAMTEIVSLVLINRKPGMMKAGVKNRMPSQADASNEVDASVSPTLTESSEQSLTKVVRGINSRPFQDEN